MFTSSIHTAQICYENHVTRFVESTDATHQVLCQNLVKNKEIRCAKYPLY